MGSCAMLLGRPGWKPGMKVRECCNDANGFVTNFWRAIKNDPEAVAHHADHPAFENDLHARHAWLIGRRRNIVPQLEGDPNWYNARIAGWWVWGMALWIGHGFCSSKGPWRVVETDNGKELLRLPDKDMDGISRQLIQFGGDQGVKRKIPNNIPKEILTSTDHHVQEWFSRLQTRFADVRVACGDWTRVCTDSTTIHTADVNAVFLDPPFGGDSGRVDKELYSDDDPTVAGRVLQWCVERGPDPRFRIALCGYDSEHNVLADTYGWDVYEWKGPAGYANQGESVAKENRKLERIWFSPHCLKPQEKPSLGLF